MTKVEAIEFIKKFVREASGENVRDWNCGAYTKGDKHVTLAGVVPAEIEYYSRGHKGDPKYRTVHQIDIRKLTWNRLQNRYYISDGEGGCPETMSNLPKAALLALVELCKQSV